MLERDGEWATALRREFAAREFAAGEFAAGSLAAIVAPPPIRLIETRSWDECWQRLGQSPAALVAAELTEAGIGRMVAALRGSTGNFRGRLLSLWLRGVWPPIAT